MSVRKTTKQATVWGWPPEEGTWIEPRRGGKKPAEEGSLHGGHSKCEGPEAGIGLMRGGWGRNLFGWNVLKFPPAAVGKYFIFLKGNRQRVRERMEAGLHASIDGPDCRWHGHGGDKWMETLETEGTGWGAGQEDIV